MACHLVVFSDIATYLVILGGFNILNFSPWAAILWYFQTLPHIWLLQWLKCPGWRKSCCVLKSCKIFGPWPAILWYFQTLPCGWLQIEELKFYPLNIAFLVASIDWIFTVAGNLVVPSKIENIGWLQQLKLFPVACNLVVFSNIVTYLVSSIIQIFPRGWKSCCIFKYGKILGGFNNLNFPPVASNPVVFSNIAKYLVASINEKFCPFLTILLYFQILPNIGRLQNIGGLQ